VFWGFGFWSKYRVDKQFLKNKGKTRRPAGWSGGLQPQYKNLVLGSAVLTLGSPFPKKKRVSSLPGVGLKGVNKNVMPLSGKGPVREGRLS